MQKYSVKKPFTVLVAVILVLVLGVVSLVSITTDLLPTISLPYLLVITVDPGASPEQVENDVTKVLENSLSTINGVKDVSSSSDENYSMLYLEFADGTNMDSAMVKTSAAINQIQSSLPETCQTPIIMEISPDMLATQYVAVDYEGKDIYELSDYVQDEIIPNYERQDGVASVSATGLIERTVNITLNSNKIEDLNDRILSEVSSQLAEAKVQLNSAKAQLDQAKQVIDSSKSQLAEGQNQLNQQQASLTKQLCDAIEAANGEMGTLETQLAGSAAQISTLKNTVHEIQMVIGPLASQYIGGNIPQEAFEGMLYALSQLDPAYDASSMPTSTDDLLASPAKTNALRASATRARTSLFTSLNLPTDTTVDSLSAFLVEQEATLAQLNATRQEMIERGEPTTEIDAQIAALEAYIHALTVTKDTTLPLLDAIYSLCDSATAVQEAEASMIVLQQQLDQLNVYRGQLQSGLESYNQDPLNPNVSSMASQLLLSGMNAQLMVGQVQLSSGEQTYQQGLAQYTSALEQYETARESALENANADQLLTLTNLSSIIYAQNFSMPAGYIQGGEGDDHSYVIKIGDNFDRVEDLRDMLLVSMDGIGDVRLSDVADLEVTDNADESYAKVNENQAVLLSIYKSSTASTSEVSDTCNALAKDLMKTDANVNLVNIMDQGAYIRLIVNSVMTNLIEGAILAIIVLAIFLKDIRPTIIVAISMPLSVMFAIVLMYFSGITLNMISLSGLALGIGMLVDNSIVVIENIYRLRGRGIPAPRAAVQGSRQVSSSIISSTLTTICVFAPLLFTTGLVRELLSDMALTISFSLIASLIVALSVVPCAASTVLKKDTKIRHSFMDRVSVGYEKLLRVALKHKVIPVVIAVALLGVTTVSVFQYGITLIPDISSDQLSVTVTAPETVEKVESYSIADDAMVAMESIEGIETVGAMSAGSAGGVMAGMGSLGSSAMGGGSNRFTFYLVLDEDGAKNQTKIQEEILAKTADLNCTVEVSSASSMDISALTGSGVQVTVSGNDLSKLLMASNQVMNAMGEVEGITDIHNGQDEGDKQVRISVNKDRCRELGLTVAQVYQQLAQALTTSKTATTLTINNESYDVNIIDETHALSLDDLMNFEFTATVMDATGASSEEKHYLYEFATQTTENGYTSIAHDNGARTITVSSATEEGYNTALLSRQVQEKLNHLDLEPGYTAEIGGESTMIDDMILKMLLMMLLALIMIYLIMVAQFQSLLSPFIVLFTIPLAFTGGMLGLMLFHETLSLMSLMGFLMLMGVVVNNGIVFVDYTNQLRMGGISRREALVATGKTRMRPILMTTLTTVLAMVTMLFSKDPGSEMGRGMAIVIIAGLIYSTLMTLFIVPILYDILYKKEVRIVDVGEDGMDDLPDDAKELAEQLAQRQESEEEEYEDVEDEEWEEEEE